jgi:hypothetical protein
MGRNVLCLATPRDIITLKNSEMNILKIKATDDPRVFAALEKRGLIRTLQPTARVLRSPRGRGAMELVYASNPRFGGHKLICVKPDSPLPKLNFHPDNEVFILIDTRAAAIRPLYMLIGRLRSKQLAEKARRGKLSADDFVLFRMAFNRAVSVFTMCKDTAHCEIVFPGRGSAPVFFVAEPSRLPMHAVALPGYSFQLGR